jgi:hypothetical protein
VGKVIGRGGETISGIQKRTGVKIMISKTCDSSDATLRVLTLTGTNIDEAIEELEAIVPVVFIDNKVVVKSNMKQDEEDQQTATHLVKKKEEEVLTNHKTGKNDSGDDKDAVAGVDGWEVVASSRDIDHEQREDVRDKIKTTEKESSENEKKTTNISPAPAVAKKTVGDVDEEEDEDDGDEEGGNEENASNSASGVTSSSNKKKKKKGRRGGKNKKKKGGSSVLQKSLSSTSMDGDEEDNATTVKGVMSKPPPPPPASTTTTRPKPAPSNGNTSSGDDETRRKELKPKVSSSEARHVMLELWPWLGKHAQLLALNSYDDVNFLVKAYDVDMESMTPTSPSSSSSSSNRLYKHGMVEQLMDDEAKEGMLKKADDIKSNANSLFSKNKLKEAIDHYTDALK